MFQNAIESVLMLYGLLLIGFAIARKEWFRGGTDLLCSLLTKIILPLNVFRSIRSYLTDLSELVALSGLIVWIGLTLLLLAAIGCALSSLLKLPRLKRGVFTASGVFPNILLLGFPIVESVLGESSMKYAVVYYLVDTVLLWSLGTYLLLYFGDNSGKTISLKENLKKVISSPSLIFLFLGILVSFLRIPIPGILEQIITKVSQCSTAISMIFIGSVIRQSQFSRTMLSKDLISVLLWKIVGVPALILLLFSIMPMPNTARQVCFLIMVMPVCVNFNILTHEYRCDSEYAAIVSASMNVLCIAALPCYTLILSHIW